MATHAPNHAGRLTTIAEAGHTLAGHGLSDEFGDVSAPGGWNALVYLSTVLLLNAGETEAAEQWASAWGDSRITAWVQANEIGQHNVVMYARTDSESEYQLLTAWDQTQAEATA